MLHARVQDIFRDIFDDDELIITESSNSEEIEDWDSLNHVNLVASIEKAFGIKFALGELQELKNVGEMLDLILKKIGEKEG
ncbi:acyl carrier protein [Helicobacter enhydrae]|uniref:Acyl carrier protein n=1 Tax=Helicobacter enhydrae TaxID=222136 RepID=A0A1B1U3K1_9HELI|nr:acyl carrier protein [Helicobacter enhydrae]